MKITTHEINQTRIAEVISDEIIIQNAQDGRSRTSGKYLLSGF